MLSPRTLLAWLLVVAVSGHLLMLAAHGGHGASPGPGEAHGGHAVAYPSDAPTDPAPATVDLDAATSSSPTAGMHHSVIDGLDRVATGSTRAAPYLPEGAFELLTLACLAVLAAVATLRARWHRLRRRAEMVATSAQPSTSPPARLMRWVPRPSPVTERVVLLR